MNQFVGSSADPVYSGVHIIVLECGKLSEIFTTLNSTHLRPHFYHYLYTVHVVFRSGKAWK